MKAVFFDRDGVIVKDVGFVHKINDFEFEENAIKGLKLLKGFKLFIVTNQSGIGRKIYSLQDFKNFNAYLLEELGKNGIKVQETYFCPHVSEDNCECRKPKTKFLKMAEKEHRIDLKKSYMVGDRKSDFDFGKKGGLATIHVLTGEGERNKNEVNPDYFAKDLLDAAKWILNNEKNK